MHIALDVCKRCSMSPGLNIVVPGQTTIPKEMTKYMKNLNILFEVYDVRKISTITSFSSALVLIFSRLK